MSAVVAGMRPIRMKQHWAEGIVDDAIWTANVGSLEVSHQRESVADSLRKFWLLQAPRRAKQSGASQWN